MQAGEPTWFLLGFVPGRWKHQPQNRSPSLCRVSRFCRFRLPHGRRAALQRSTLAGRCFMSWTMPSKTLRTQQPRVNWVDCETHLNQMRQECGLPCESITSTLFSQSPRSQLRFPDKESRTNCVLKSLLAADWEKSVEVNRLAREAAFAAAI